MMYAIKSLWQGNFYGHAVRKKQSLNTIAEYIVNNLVRKNIVRQWDEYPFSKINYGTFEVDH